MAAAPGAALDLRSSAKAQRGAREHEPSFPEIVLRSAGCGGDGAFVAVASARGRGGCSPAPAMMGSCCVSLGGGTNASLLCCVRMGRQYGAGAWAVTRG
eukprot:8366875-Alexandrium_andersonii.AAC.1